VTDSAFRLTVAFAQAHETLQEMWGASYASRIDVCRGNIRAAMAKFRCTAIEAPMRIVEEGKRNGVTIDGLLLAALMAAAVDELERRPCAGRA
jgi:hypothetical protein